MIEFKLQIDCKTVAFGDRPELHLADILRGVANTLQYVGSAVEEKQAIRTPVTDVNGIQCGRWSLVDRQTEVAKEAERQADSAN